MLAAGNGYLARCAQSGLTLDHHNNLRINDSLPRQDQVEKVAMLDHFWPLFTPFACRFGLTCMAAQCALSLAFARILPKGPWSEDPGFTAHQVVTVPLMAYLTYHGMREWYSKDDHGYTALDRILGPHPKPDLSEVVMAMMFFWDIPTGFLVRSLRNPAMVAHHIAMFATSTLALGAWSDGHALLGYYAAYYFGAIEISSIPLILVDLFHPKHKAWHEYYQSAPTWLKRFNEINRICFAILFLGARAISFPYVSFTTVIPDLWHVASLPVEERIVSVYPLYGMAILNTFFSLLQLYWGSLVLRQVVKALTPSKTKRS